MTSFVRRLLFLLICKYKSIIATTLAEIIEYGSIDTYRCGKSLRKKGFDSAKFFEEKSSIEQQLNQQVKEWINTVLEISVVPTDSCLTEKREWLCKLPEGIAKIFCGGTHPKELRLDTVHSIQIKLSNMTDSPEFVMSIKY